ncbi:molybdate ABC transporter permease subunit [Qingshengfaniella alkalisoli]|uniref:Molybdenum transport system permease n=1 Tax=Qingshengfaniella alkalisoli TaxID=2599296 RepID=A0A5B8IS20_9RHOB|nr:molybdate ABC transporter permease subunit [Qingshengfaniella alkalisoli]QDY69012.1 molybdate ABC transporter permease subunit [Qingshengfaniella alkalisoli]
MSIWEPVWLTLRLATVTTLCLLVIATPTAWWLASSRSRWRPLVEAVTALPLVLPPTVLGFYLLVLLSPTSFVGSAWLSITGGTLTFSFTGLVIASIVYSLPFAVQPLHTAFRGVGQGLREAAATLGAGPLDRFRSIVLPLSRQGFLAAAVLSFAHTLGEFGVVLMVGGNIPGETRVIAVEIYTAVETLDYRTAHILSAGLLLVSLTVLTIVYRVVPGQSKGR